MKTASDAQTDHQLLIAWRAGDNAAGAALFERHWRSVTRFFSTKVGPAGEDLVQQTFLTCIESAHGYRGEGSFRAYLLGIARFTLLRHFRARRQVPATFDPARMSLAASARSCTSMLFAKREQARLIAALQTLPLDTQMALELHYWEGLTIREISVVLECPVNTIKARLRRGRMRLAERLAPREREAWAQTMS